MPKFAPPGGGAAPLRPRLAVAVADLVVVVAESSSEPDVEAIEAADMKLGVAGAMLESLRTGM